MSNMFVLMIIIIILALLAAWLYFYVKEVISQKKLYQSKKTFQKREPEEIHIFRQNGIQQAPEPRNDSVKYHQSGKRRFFYGDQVLSDANFVKKALKAYLRGDYYFVYHSKRFRTPEIWR